MDLHALCPAQSANHISSERFLNPEISHKFVSGAQLGAGFSGSGWWRDGVAAESRGEERCGRSKGLRSAIVVALAGASAITTVAAGRALGPAAE